MQVTFLKNFKGNFGIREFDIKKGEKVELDKNEIVHFQGDRFQCVSDNIKESNKKKDK